MPSRVPFLGLTGGLGAGKSEALRVLAELGAATLSTDAVVHELLQSDELRDIVVERLGPDVVRDGALDRSLIRE
jgi:dephospho-CoA kinase